MSATRPPRKRTPPAATRVGLQAGPGAHRGSAIDTTVLDALRHNAAALTHALLLADVDPLLAETPVDTTLPAAAPLTIESLDWAALEGAGPATTASALTTPQPQDAHASADAIAAALAALAPGAPALTQVLDAEGLAHWTARLQQGDPACEHLLRLLRGLETAG